MLNQAETKSPPSETAGAGSVRALSWEWCRGPRRRMRVMGCGLATGLALLASCSQDSSRRENSELRAEAPIAAERKEVPAAAPSNQAADQPAEQLPNAGSRYRVAVGTAYFFDEPEQSKPSGRYLRRGDTFYGEGESNGFVKTGFVQPNGVAGSAWLKVQELRRLSAGPAATVAGATVAPRPQPRPRPAAPPPPPADNSDEADQNAAYRDVQRQRQRQRRPGCQNGGGAGAPGLFLLRARFGRAAPGILPAGR